MSMTLDLATDATKARWSGPLTQNQQDIYFEQQQYPDCALYNVGGFITLPAIQVNALEQAHRRIVESHDVFALRMKLVEGQVQQYLAPSADTTLIIEDFSEKQQPEQDFQQWLTELFQTPIDVHGERLHQAFLIKVSQSKFYYVGIAHHIVMDGWGFANWAAELGKYYNAIIDERVPDTHQTQWQTVVEREQAFIGSRRFVTNEKYWENALSQHKGHFLQPKYRSAYAGTRFIPGSRKSTTISRAQHNKLSQVASQCGVSVSQLYFAIIAHYFARTYQQQTLCFGFPVHNRRGAAEKQLLGTFSSVSPVMLRVEASDTLRHLCQQIANQLGQVFRHQRFPLSRMRKFVDSAEHNQHLFDVNFNYIDVQSGFQVGDEMAELTYCSHQSEQLPIKFSVWDHGNIQDVAINIDFNRAYFCDWDIDFLQDRLRWLITQVCELEGDCLLANLSVLPAEEVQYLLNTSRSAAVQPIQGDSLYEVVSLQAQRTPERVAINDGQLSYTYQECVEQADALALAVYQQCQSDLSAMPIVGVCMSRSADLVVALLAINRLGLAYVALDANYPQERTAYMLHDANVQWVLVDSTTEGFCSDNALTQMNVTQLMSAQNVTASTISADTAVLTSSTQWAELPPLAPSELAYLIYTSGSTGKPKGVMISQSNALSLLSWAKATYSEQQLACVLAATSVCFDLSFFEIFAPLSAGGTVRMVDNVLALSSLADASNVTLLNTVPSAIEALLKTSSLPNSLRVINLAGEPLLTDTVNRLKTQLPATQIFDLYGPSECTTYATFGERFTGTPANIGRPLPGTLACVLDEQQQLTAAGVEGELFLAGPGLSPGYFEQLALTDERFSTFSIAANQAPIRLYKTGDQVRWQADGTLQYLGRLDNQIKLRGFRIELDEIKNVLLSLADVEEVQLLVSGHYQSAQLIAFVVATENKNNDAETLLATLRHTALRLLPEYMQPNQYQLCEAFPRLPNGKVDSNALQAMLQLNPTQVVAPSNELEKQLHSLWTTLLNCSSEMLSTQDNFFKLGGNSLLGLQMMHQVNVRYQASLTVADVFQAPTIQALATKIQQTPKLAEISALQASPKTLTCWPLSPAQYRIWFMHEMRGAGASQNLPLRVQYQGTLDVTQFNAVLNLLLQENPVLRCAMRLNAKDEAEQYLSAITSLAVQTIDLTELPSDQQVIRAEQKLSEDALTEFDLKQPPLWRALVIKHSNNRVDIQFTFHHIICDGWSAMLFLEQVFSRLDAINSNAEKQGQSRDYATSALSYLDYCYTQKIFLKGQEAQSQRRYWRDALQDCPPVLSLPWNVKLPVDKPSKPLVLPLSHTLTVAVQQLAKSNGCTTFQVLHTCLTVLLARITGQLDLVIGSPAHGRHIAGTDALLGVFLNLLPLRSRLDSSASFQTELERNRQVSVDALSNQDIPYEECQAIASESSASVSNALFNVMLNMLSLPSTLDKFNQVTLVTDLLTAIPSKFDLTLYVLEEKETPAQARITLYATYDSEKYNGHSVHQALQQLHRVIEQAVAAPQRCWLDFSLGGATPALTELPATVDALCVNQCIQQVTELHPQALAISYVSQRWTYRQLSQFCDNYAQQLQQRGVGSDKNAAPAVVIFAKREPALVAAILAVLKLGAHFALLSPEQGKHYLRSQLDIIRPTAWIGFDEASRATAQALGLTAESGVVFNATSAKELTQLAPLAPVATNADTLAYISFTSGTTGKPKAIYGQHSSIARFIPVVAQRYPYELGANVAMLSGLIHDPLLRDIFFTIGTGGCLHIPDEPTYQSAGLLPWLAKNAIAIVNLTPSLGRKLESYTEQPLPALKQAFFGGEPLAQADVAAFKKRCPNAAITNVYGTTETGRVLSAFDIDESELTQSVIQASPQFNRTGHYPIGQCWAGAELVVLNANYGVCDFGEVGQIAMLSPHLPNGGSQFAANKSAIKLAAGVAYLTGDLGRRLSSGDVECLGRNDQQLKLRGFRIEPSEITFQLTQHPSVERAEVFCVDVNKQTASLCAALLVTHSAPSVSSFSESLRAFLITRLPAHAIPSQFVVLPAFPLTANNKINTRKLQQLAMQTLAETNQSALVAPSTETEQKLHDIWCQLFEVTQVSVSEAFYVLGGNSLLATKLISQLQRQFNIEFSYRDFLEDSSIRAVAQKIDAELAQRLVVSNDVNNRKMTLKI